MPKHVVSEAIFGKDAFTHQKLNRLDAIRDDLGVHPTGFRVAHVLASYINAHTGLAWPKKETLSKRVGVNRNVIAGHLNKLVERGHLTLVRASRGRGHSDVYALTPVEDAEAASVASQMCHADVARSPQLKTFTTTKRNADVALTCNVGVAVTPSVGTTEGEGMEEEADEGTSGARASRGGCHGGDVAFERFWEAYPKRRGVDLARSFFKKAIEGGADAETIIAGAIKYAKEREGEDEKFTKFASNWLREKKWEEPAAPRIKRPPPKRATSPSVFDVMGALGYLEEEAVVDV